MAALGLGCAVLVAGCSSQTIVLPSRDFDRPTDIAFGCVGIFKDASGAVTLSGQPMDRCHPPGVQDPHPGAVDADGTQYRTYGYMTNAGRGDLSVIDLSYCRSDDGTCYPPGADIVDLDSESPGFTAAPVGEIPEVVAASQDGCRVVTANRGSCDLTVLDPSTLLAKKWDVKDVDPRDGILSVAPRTAGGVELDVAPAEIAFLPQQTATLGGNPALCTRDGTLAAPVGAAAIAGTPAPWQAVVTFPSCDLIAVVELPSGNIVDSYQLTVDDSGYVYHHTGADPVCAQTDCGPRATASCAATAGAGAGIGGAGGSGAGIGGVGGGGAGIGGAAGSGAAIGGAGGDTAGGGGAAAGDGEVGGGAGAAEAAAVSAATPAAGQVCSGLRIGPLAVRPEGTRLYFGANNVPYVGALDLAAGGTLSEPTVGKNTLLTEGATGSLRLRLSVDPYEYIAGHATNPPTVPEYGKFVSAVNPDVPFEFLYVIARDSTLRALDVSGALSPAPVECDLTIDPTDPNAHAIVTRDVSGPQATDAVIPRPTPCFPVHAPGGPRRMPYWPGVEPHVAAGPGLRFPSPPVDIAVGSFLTAEQKDLTSTEALTVSVDESVLNGAYGFVLTSSGLVYVLNIDPVLRKTAVFVAGNSPVGRIPGRVTESPIPLVNSLRDTSVITYSTSLGTFAGAPRLDSDPLQASQVPRLREFQPANPSINTTDSSINARAVPVVDTTTGAVSESNTPLSTFVYFPNRYMTRPQTWQVTWEGALSGTRFSGVLGASPDASAFTLTDQGAPFCAVGALPGDVVTLGGCQQDADCPTRVCVRSQRIPTSVDGRLINGLCLPPETASALRDGECRDLLESFRRYEITSATALTVTLHPKLVELPRPAHLDDKGNLVSCVTSGTTDDCPSVSGIAYSCQPVERIPSLPINRCVITCSATKPCSQGTHCHTYSTGISLCAEGADIDLTSQQACLDQLSLYQVSAGNTFVVTGSVFGRPDVVTQSPIDQTCSVDSNAPASLRISRIPMTTPDCTVPAPGAWSDLDLAGQTTLTQPTAPAAAASGAVPTWITPNPCVVRATPDNMAKGVKTATVWFQNQELRFALENFDQPFPFTTQMTFDVHGGLAPMQVTPVFDASPTLPNRIIVGPVSALEQLAAGTPDASSGFLDVQQDAIPESNFPYLYVVDQRQYAGGRLIGRGQLLRIHPRITSVAPGFEGATLSNHYFPIQ